MTKVKGHTPHYKVVECATVTDEELEKIVNEWVPQGYHLDGVHFAMREASRRPSMAFLFFIAASSREHGKS